MLSSQDKPRHFLLDRFCWCHGIDKVFEFLLQLTHSRQACHCNPIAIHWSMSTLKLPPEMQCSSDSKLSSSLVRACPELRPCYSCCAVCWFALPLQLKSHKVAVAAVNSFLRKAQRPHRLEEGPVVFLVSSLWHESAPHLDMQASQVSKALLLCMAAASAGVRAAGRMAYRQKSHILMMLLSLTVSR